MRLWSLHPKYLDKDGLVACWREGLLAQKVLHGQTKGYKSHSQLERFKGEYWPAKIGLYLWELYYEADRRRYKFDNEKIRWWSPIIPPFQIHVTTGQIDHESGWLYDKIRNRNPDCKEFKLLQRDIIDNAVEPHPLFKVINGPIESWEKVKN